MRTYRIARYSTIVLFILLCCGQQSFAESSEEICIFQDAKGVMQQAKGRGGIPAQFRKQARCFESKMATNLAKPEEIDLKGTVRRDSIASSVGRIELRWPRKVELLFGRTPQRAMADAASVVSRALKKPGFPIAIQNLDLDWQVVFMDEELPEKQIPAYLVGNCHPAWMTPPANIYVVSQRVVAGCAGGRSFDRKQADPMLAQVLIHEMGHAVEAQLLGERGQSDRLQAEGFASWFEQYAADFSSVIPAGQIERFYTTLAKEAIESSPDVFTFSGSAADYARASMYFKAVEKRKGVRGVADLYSILKVGKLDLFQAMESKLNWDRARADKEAALAADLARR